MRLEYVVRAKTVDEAYKKALDLYSALGEITMEKILKPGKKGFLGIGAELAEILVTVDDGKGDKYAKKLEKAEKPVSPVVEAPKPKAQPVAVEKKAIPKAEKPAPKAEKPVQKTEKPTPKAEKPAVKAENTDKPASPKVEKKKPQEKKVPKQPRPEREPLKNEDIKVTEEEKLLAMNFLKTFIADIGFKCEVIGDLTKNEEGFVPRLVTIEGEDASNLIGHHGETLDAVQYLANLCLARKSDSDHKEYVKVIVDIENYRAKREETLRALARKMAEKALRQNRNIHLDPMNSYERRIIHSEIQKIEGVSTHSVGYDENRKIVITVDRKKAN
ncbi:MAG: KH domain-containing protein [Clostridia bacterium]|nr:KH domain-containing protein [Clostridia bacterium]